jgi:AraC-like DNA-binding protein
MPIEKHIQYSHKHGFTTAAKSSSITPMPGSFESSWHFSGSIGDGNVRKLKMHPGFDLWIADCHFAQNVIVSSDDIFPSLSFNFYLSGHSVSTMGTPDNTFELKGGQQGVCYFSANGETNRVGSKDPLRFICMNFDPDRLMAYFEDDRQRLPAVLRKIGTQKCGKRFWYIKNITPTMRIALHQIVNCPYRGMARKLYLESRALELIAYQLDQFSTPEPSDPPADILHPHDRERTALAQSLLIHDVENPPNLKELARAAGMSHPKLNRCFRRLYGMTAFQYLKNERLNQARVMLENQGFSVTETAYAIGYDSISHFSQAYKKQFGVSPGTCIRKN